VAKPAYPLAASAPPSPAGAVSPAHDSARIFGLDLLRAAAILSVLFAHLFAVLYPHVWWLGILGHGGFYGVELFFVLSGFLIGKILVGRGPDFATGGALPEFYLRRWFRTLPLFWLLLAVNVLLDRYEQSVHYPASVILEQGFFLRNFASYRMTFLPESWSLAVEEWFYLLFPAALWLGLRLRIRFDRVFLVTAAAFYLFSTGARMVSAPHDYATWGDWQRVIVIDRFDAIMTGMIGAWLASRFPAGWRNSAWICAIAGSLLLVAMYATLWRIAGNWVATGADSFFARTWRFNLVSLGFALLLPAASGWSLSTENFASTGIRRIALWSYAMYLTQHPLSRLIMPYIFKDWQTSALQAWSLFATVLGATIALSALLHHVFEAPCTRLRDTLAPALIRRFYRAPANPA
jgi:peptidoglycan/LPS O-acetylase OafA/YrhL